MKVSVETWNSEAVAAMHNPVTLAEQAWMRERGVEAGSALKRHLVGDTHGPRGGAAGAAVSEHGGVRAPAV